VANDQPRRVRRPPRDARGRRQDHAEIDRLADVVLPDLIDRLAASDLAEIEIREDDWRIRLRRPPESQWGGPPDRAAADHADRAADRPTRPASAHGGPDQRGPRDPREGQPLRPAVSGGESNGNGTGPGTPAGPHRVMATSPAVGVFQPRADVRPGSRVRAGDRVATVDLLGLPQDVVAPEDGVVVDTLVEPGQGVEYGQDLVVIEASRARHGAEGAVPPFPPMTES
jgi:biotin carboxyl carrier protein